MDQKYLFNKKFDRRILVAICILGFILRLSMLSYAEFGLLVDEAELVTDAISLLGTGTDKNDNAWPLFFHAFGHEEGSVLAYFLTIPFAIFGSSDLVAKIVVIIVNFLILPLGFLVSKRWFGEEIALATTFFLAISPWQLNLSRLVYNVSFVLLLYMAGYFCFTKGWQENKKMWLIAAFVIFGVSFYSYPLSWIWIGLWLLIWNLSHFHEFKTIRQSENKERRLGLLIGLGIFLFIILPVILWIKAGSQQALNFGPFFLPKVAEFRFDEVGSGEWSQLGKVLKDYVRHWSPIFWFSDSRNFDFTPYFGLMYFMEFPFFFLGAVTMMRYPKRYLFLWLWLIIGWIPSALSGDNVPHPLRSVSIVPVLSMISGLGLVRVLRVLKTKEKSKITSALRFGISVLFGMALFGNIVAFIVLNQSDYHKKYWLSVPKTGYGLEEAAKVIETEWGRYDRIEFISKNLDEPWIHLIRYSPFLLQKYKKLTLVSGLTERNSFERLEKLFVYRKPRTKKPEPNILYIVDPGIYPEILSLQTISYPLNLGPMLEIKTALPQ